MEKRKIINAEARRKWWELREENCGVRVGEEVK